MASTDEGIMVLLQNAIEEVDSKDLRALLEEAIKAPGPHHSVSGSAQADPRVHVVLTTNDGATLLPKRGFITKHSGLIHDLLADADGEVIKDPVPMPNVAARELTRMLWLLGQGFDAKQLERCISAFDIERVVALQQAANFMDVRRITGACGGAIAGLVRKAADDEERAQLLELVTPPRLPQELCELWLGRCGSKADGLLKLLTSHPDQLLAPLAHWDAGWADKGRFSKYCFKLWNETEFTLLKTRVEVIKEGQGASSLKVRLHKETNTDHLRSVWELSVLTSLDLQGCDQITSTGLTHVKVLMQLTSLNLGDCYKITDVGLTYVKVLTQLTSLNLGGCNQITNIGLAHVKELAQLTSLNLAYCNSTTDTGLVQVKELKQLKELSLSGVWQLTDAGLEHVKELTQLTSLHLSGGCHHITDAGLVHIKELTQLTSLNLGGCYKITDVGLAYLKVLTQLTSLDLYDCKQITDVGLAHVKELTQLKRLNLGGWFQITEEGLMHVKELAQLKELNLGSYKNISREGGLFASILVGHLDTYALLRADVTWKLPDGTTLLHVAVQRNRKEAIEALLKRGADVNAVDDRGRTPLQLTIVANVRDAIRLLQESSVQN